MQLNKNIIFIVLMASSNLACANLEGLISGISCDADFSSRPDAEKEVIRNIGSTFSVNNIDSGVSCKAWAGSAASGHWFELSSDIELYGVNVSTKQYLGNWPLTRWEHILFPEEIGLFIGQYGYSYRQNIGDPTPDENQGCIGAKPLKYGDIEADAENELVLSLGGELIVFSPTYGRTVFSMFWYANDWVGLTTADNADLNGQPSAFDDGASYQFSSMELGYDVGPHKGHRSYTKVFDGDFDGDGNFDLIAWQKVYESNKVGEAEGFTLINNRLVHFARDLDAQAKSETGITGEYLPQETSENEIKSWLADNELTWSKGYPSVSECEGEEGQLIPEMHDALLNDPEVLK